jgi:hypothetical protein
MMLSSPRTAGTHNHRRLCFASRWPFFLFQNNRHEVWVPAFAGTTWDIRRDVRYGVAIPNFFNASSIRRGGSILMISASPVSSRLFRLERIAGQP